MATNTTDTKSKATEAEANTALAADTVTILHGPTAGKLVPVSNPDLIKAIKDAFGDDRIEYDSAADAFRAVQSTVDSLTKDDEGNVTAELPFPIVSRFATAQEFGESRVFFALVQPEVTTTEGKKARGIAAGVIYAVPSVEEFFADEEGKKKLDTLLSKEAGLVQFRPIRGAATAESLLIGLRKTPVGVHDYCTSNRGGGGDGIDSKLFDAFWMDARRQLKKRKPDLEQALPGKREVRDCMRSKAYALAGDESVAVLERRNVFVMLLSGLITMAKKSGKDTKVLDDWLAERDALVIERTISTTDPDAIEAMDLSDLTDWAAAETEAESAGDEVNGGEAPTA